MLDLNRIAACCGVVFARTAGGLVHHATAWSAGQGDWVTAWPGEEPEIPPEGLHLILAADGTVHALSGWEYEAGVVGMTGPDIGPGLGVRPAGQPLRKRDRLMAFAYPDMIDHPAVSLARRELTPELYYPWLCPWTVQGHLCLFTSTDGFLTGGAYPGMAGGPVLDEGGLAVGVVLGGESAPGQPPLTRFRRLA